MFLFSSAGGAGTAGGASAADAAAAAGGAGGVGAGLTTIGAGTPSLAATLGDTAGAASTLGGTFGGLGGGATGGGLTGIGAGTPALATGLGIGGSTVPYGAGTLGGSLGGVAPSLLYGTGGLLGATTGLFQSTPGISPNQGPASYVAQNVFNPQPGLAQKAGNLLLHPTGSDLLDNLLVGLTLSSSPDQSTAQGGERGIQPQQLPNQIPALPPTQNRGRMGFNANGILSWLPQTPQIPQAPSAPGTLPPLGPYRG